MIDGQTYGIIQLLGSGLTGESRVLPTEFSLERAAETILGQQIASLIYTGALTCGIPKEQPAMVGLCEAVSGVRRAEEEQTALLARLLGAFEQEKIDYLPLRGVILKSLYPSRDMREIYDADFLIRREQFDAACEIMTRQGYDSSTESPADACWSKEGLAVGLHKSLFPSEDETVYDLFGDGWSLARLQEKGSREYGLPPEEQMVYLAVCAARRYRAGGLGIKYLCDLWLLRKKYPKMNLSDVRKVLGHLQLLRFFENTERTLAAWFDHQPMTEEAELITKAVFSGGAYGSPERLRLSRAGEERGKGSPAGEKLSKTRRIAFPGYEAMCLQFPKLKNRRLLLPAYWLLRILRTLFLRPETISRSLKSIEDSEEEKIRKYRKELEAVGLPPDFPDLQKEREK